MQGNLFHLRGGDDSDLAQDILDSIGRARGLDPNNPEVLDWYRPGTCLVAEASVALRLAIRAVEQLPMLNCAVCARIDAYDRDGRSDEAIVAN